MTLPAEKLITINDRGARTATTFGSVTAGGADMVFIKKLTASADANLTFVDGASSVVLDSTYKEYLFTFNNIHPATDDSKLLVNFRDGGTNYDATKTTTFFRAQHSEGGANGNLSYRTDDDLAQSTAAQPLTMDIGNANDESASGEMILYNPSSTTFVKHFIANANCVYSGDYSMQSFVAGYCNVTAAIDAVQFTMEGGTNIDSGDICLYGIL